MEEIKYLNEAGEAFDFAKATVKYEWCYAGHFNVTFFVYCDDGEAMYLLQRVNTSIFTKPVELQQNIRGVCEHVAMKIEAEGGEVNREVRRIIKT